MSVPAGVTSKTVANVRGVGGVSAVASVGLSKVTAVGAGGRSVMLTLASVVPDQFAPLAPVLIGRATAPLSDGAVMLSSLQRDSLGVAPGDTIRLVAGYNQRAARVAALDVTTFADGIVASSTALPGLVKPTMLLVGVNGSENSDRVAVALAQRLGQSVSFTGKTPKFMMGRGVSRLFGSFSYIVHPDGRISASPRWARTYIRSRKVAILGTVTCHKLMLPQLARAMREIELNHLGGLIDRRQYGGCYVARTILWDPSNPPSMHAWGLAIDLNVSTNRYGARPTMDPRIVAIFEKWGFNWGGRWKTPDGMHFELGALLKR
ncbi:MAG: M15 family metallopeptidase [Actinomycetota bacterium]